jgi:hypothetical protein
MEDHDQRFKTLLQLRFADFLRLFFSTWAERFDLRQVEWLNLEAFPDPPKGRRRTLDLVAKLRVRSRPRSRPAAKRGPWLALVHVEIESRDRVVPLRPRMWNAYHHLRQKYGLPVLPIALYLRVGLNVSGQLKAASGGEFKSSHFTGSAVRGWFSSTHLMLMEIAHGECSGNGDCSSNSKLICRKMVPAPDRA